MKIISTRWASPPSRASSPHMSNPLVSKWLPTIPDRRVFTLIHSHLLFLLYLLLFFSFSHLLFELYLLVYFSFSHLTFMLYLLVVFDFFTRTICVLSVGLFQFSNLCALSIGIFQFFYTYLLCSIYWYISVFHTYSLFSIR